jgi:hypothetical protein
VSAVLPDTGVTGKEDLDVIAATYRRLAAMDPPALRALIVELRRLSDESRELAARLPSVQATARAGRAASRAKAAQAALAAEDERRWMSSGAGA